MSGSWLHQSPENKPMVRLESIEDEMRGVVTYRLKDGRMLQLDARAVREHGAAALLRDMGHGDELPTERMAVVQRGRRIGTLPPDFDPLFIKSNSFWYDPRPGDFRRDGNVWVANKMLGPSDLEAVPGFVWDRQP